MSKANTLLNYFSKKGTPGKTSNDTEEQSASTKAVKDSKKEESRDECEFVLGDLVWSKLEGYPWWPSMVCNHPTQNKHYKGKANKSFIHVQFFDDPISRGWVKAKFVKAFTGSDHPDFAVRGGQFYSSDLTCMKGAEQADEAEKMSRADRLGTFLVELLSTEESSDEEEPMEPITFDSDIFDAEDDGQDSGKENAEVNKAQRSPSKTPRKTPKKTPVKRARRSVKRRKIVESGDECEDSEDEFKPPKEAGGSSEDGSSGEDEDDVTEPSASEPDTPVKGIKRKRIGSLPKKKQKIMGGPRITRTLSSDDEESEQDSPAKTSPKPTASKKLEQFEKKVSKEDSPKVKEESMEVEEGQGDGHKEVKKEVKLEKMEVESANKEEENTKKEEENKKKEEENKKKEENGINKNFLANTPKREKPREMALTPKQDSGTPKRVFTPVVSDRAKSKLASFAANDSVAGPSEEESRKFTHLTFPLLQPDKIRDAERRRPDDENYDPRTLYVPPEFMNKQTPGHRQWWELKSKYFDVVLFFKMGKFYELFHMDAVVGVNELGLIFMKGDYAHSGFPEIAYGRYAETLIQKGYKVARIEQTETPEMNAERCKTLGRTATKFDKVVRREVCSIQSKGTKRYSFLDGDASDTANAYLLAISEKSESEVGGGSTYGVCFVDTSIGKFHVGQFTDDRHCSRLRTLVSHYPPAQLLTERGRVSAHTRHVIDNTLAGTMREHLVPGKEFWDSKKTLKFLSESAYFVDEKDADKGSSEWPQALKELVDESDNLGQTARTDFELAVCALGAVTWYLKKCLVDQELLSMSNFAAYSPVDSPAEAGQSASKFSAGRQHLVLDGVTLANLEVLENASNGSREGTLIERLDMCSTPFGGRLFKQWLCAPLCSPSAIEERLDAVEDLINNPDAAAETVELLKKLPDLERLLSKIHTLGSGIRKDNHPDGRAIMYEEVSYGKKKIEDFLSTLGGFKVAEQIAQKFAGISTEFKSKLLRQTVSIGDGKEGRFPDLSEQLKYFDAAFDHQKARSDGTIKPKAGMDEVYEQTVADVASSKAALDDYLEKQKQRLGCKSLTYFGTGKNRYQMEVPEHIAKKVPDSYEVTSQRKGFKRYKTDDIEGMFGELMEAEDRKDEAIRDCLRRIFFTFDKHYQKWDSCVQCLSVLDVLLSLSQYSKCGDGGTMCRPSLRLRDDAPYLEIREARHPCMARTYGGGDFIPNDALIGCDDDGENGASRVVLVTGPNMGGKSTLMRQVGNLVVMAQLGCYVPAEKCELTPVDRVFTRLGASDRIMAGESTFFVELSETSAILQHATKHSLVLMDELGRGTATYDGTAIACAVVNELSRSIGCRSLFSTHYHSLVEQFSHDSNIRTGHMACMVENDNEEDPSQETITFLYKFIKGACPKSYGFNAARLANLPKEIVKTARQKAAHFENTVDKMRFFRELNSTKDMEKIKKLHSDMVGSL